MFPDNLELEDEVDESGDLDENFDKIGELLKVKERTPEQDEELKKLRRQRGTMAKDRINELTKKARQAESALERERQEKDDYRKRLEEKESERVERPSGKYDQMTINGKKFYTDEALSQMVEDGRLTQSEAWSQQRAAIKEEAKAEMKSEFKEESTRSEYERIKKDTVDEVLKEYPKFHPQHPDHNPNDPLFREASRLLNNGYSSNPRGVKLAIEDAKKLLGVSGKRPDLSDELSVADGNSAPSDSKREKKAELSEFEQNQAVRLYVFGGKVNPSTGKAYTQKEAIEKALRAKQERSSYAKR